MTRRGTGWRADEPPVRFEVGDRLADRYVLLRRLGEGGWGTVWLARNEALDALVAVKVIRGASDAGERARMLQEARAAAALRHPSVIRVYDVGTTGPQQLPFIVMEALQGETLAQRIEKRGPIPVVEAAATACYLAGALEAAHARGIVHRDVKPENIVLEPFADVQLVPKLVDFGIARMTDGSVAPLTAPGMSLGSPEYQSPEQVKAVSEIDGRADVWGLCMTLYEMVAGKRPFDGPTPLETTQNILTAPVPPWSKHGRDAPELFAIVERGLAKEPADRWSTVRDLRAALAAWLIQRRQAPGAAPSTGPRRRKAAMATVRMSHSDLEEIAAREARDGSLVERMQPAPGQPVMTAVAGTGFNVAETFNRVHREPFPGWQAEMAMPGGPSTAGGKQALQHISLIGPDGHRFAVGTIDVAQKTGTLRSYPIVDAIHRQRYGDSFPVPKAAYAAFMGKIETLFEALEMRVVMEVASIAPPPPDAGEAAEPPRWIMLALLVLLFAAIALGIALM